MGAALFTYCQRRNLPPIKFTLDVLSNPLNRAEAPWADLFIQDLNAKFLFKEKNQLHEHERRETLISQQICDSQVKWNGWEVFKN